MDSHLGLHNCLLKARSDHGLLARLLAGGPGGSAVGGLHAPDALANLGGLLESPIVTLTSKLLGRHGIGCGDVRGGLPRGRVIDLDRVLVQTGHGRGVCADSKARADRRKGHKSAATGHHIGQNFPEVVGYDRGQKERLARDQVQVGTE